METLIILIMLSAICGTSFSASNHGWIIGGNETTIEKHPYTVALLHKDNNSQTCGGSIISTRFILTAAHCAPTNRSVYARFGSTSYKEGGIVRDIITWSIHPEYVLKCYKYDIAVAEIDKEIPLGPKIAIVSLPCAGDPQVGEWITVVGWGRTQASHPDSSINLKEAIVPVFNQDACKKHFQSNCIIMENQICLAGETEGTTGVCNGDSGSPAIKDGIQYGIASYVGGVECVYPNTPQVFTRESSFLDWIAEQMSLTR